MPVRTYPRMEARLPYELAFVGGYCDAASFVLSKTFTGHVTGNLVLAAIALVSHDWRSLATHFSAISAFLVGTALGMLAMNRCQLWPSSRLLALMMLVEAVLISLASLVTHLFLFSRTETFLALLSLGLGLQNGALTRFGGVGIHTTYITGVITSLLSAETKVSAPKTWTSDVPNAGPGLLSSIWITFVLGAGIGAAMALRFNTLGLLAAAGMLSLFALIEVLS